MLLIGACILKYPAVNYIIFDLEATCWPGSPKHMRQEIIEIGAIRIDEYAEQTGSYNRFVKPVVNPTLSNFCMQLTTIEQEQVDRARRYPEVIEEFMDWIGYYDDEEYVLASWGGFDKRQLRRDCELHDLETDWITSHIDLKEQYQRIKGLRKRKGLFNSIQLEGWHWEGIHHRAISDAFNAARIFVRHFDDWRYY